MIRSYAKPWGWILDRSLWSDLKLNVGVKFRFKYQGRRLIFMLELFFYLLSDQNIKKIFLKKYIFIFLVPKHFSSCQVHPKINISYIRRIQHLIHTCMHFIFFKIKIYIFLFMKSMYKIKLGPITIQKNNTKYN